MKTDKKTLNTHTLVRTCFITFSLKLVIGCLILVVIFASSTIKAKEFSNQTATHSIQVLSAESSDGKHADRIFEPDEDDNQALVAERPGKPDKHDSNGDDVMIRPVR